MALWLGVHLGGSVSFSQAWSTKRNRELYKDVGTPLTHVFLNALGK